MVLILGQYVYIPNFTPSLQQFTIGINQAFLCTINHWILRRVFELEPAGELLKHLLRVPADINAQINMAES